LKGYSHRKRGKPHPKSLHGLCYELAGRNYVHKHNIPSPFQPTIKKWQRHSRGTNVEIEIRMVDDQFMESVIKRLSESNYFILGSTEFELIDCSLSKDATIKMDGSVPVLPDLFTIKLLSPTLFSKQRVTSTGIVYENIRVMNMKHYLHSICKYLHARFGYQTDFDMVDNIAKKTKVNYEKFEPIELRTRSSYKTDKAIHGEMTVNIKDLSIEEKLLLGKLVKLSTYVGVGQKKAFGYGQVRLERYGA